MKSSVLLHASMSPRRTSIFRSIFSCSIYAFGYVPFSIGSRNQMLFQAWCRSDAARSSALSLAGYGAAML